MKKILFILFVMGTIAKGQTPVYHPFPDSNAVWNFDFQLYCFTGETYGSYSIKISGDTVINNQTYHKLVTPFVQMAIQGTCDELQGGYKGAFRQDTVTKRVFFISPSTNTELLLYDFTMQVGDSVPGFIETYAHDTVQAIDSILVGSTYRKRWQINSCYNIYIVEGIGSTYGLVKYSPGCGSDLPSYSLNCFRQNDQTLYPNFWENCQLTTSLYSNNSPSSVINIFPNPANNMLTIKNISNSISYQIYNCTGQEVMSGNLNDVNKQIYIGELPYGLYILKTFTSNNIYYHKFLKF